MVGDSHGAVHIANVLDECFGCFWVVKAGGNGADGLCEKSEAFFCGGAVMLKNVRQDDRIGETVRRVVLAAETVRDAVDVADVGARECVAGEVSRFLQIFASDDVVTIVVSCFDVFDDEPACFNGCFGAAAEVAASDVGFYGVRERVHAGCCGETWRQV